MKKKYWLLGLMILILLGVGGGAIYFYNHEQTVPDRFADKSFRTLASDSDNHLTNDFLLKFTKNQVKITAMTNGGKPKSSFAKEVVAAFSKSQKYAGVPQVGETAKLGRVKTQKIKNGYKLETKKISLILTKKRLVSDDISETSLFTLFLIRLF